MNLLLSSLLLLSLNTTFADEYKCPKDTVLIDHTDKITGDRFVFCQKRQDGKLLKEGLELTYNKDGRIIKKDFYKNGVSVKGQKDSGVKLDKK